MLPMPSSELVPVSVIFDGSLLRNWNDPVYV